MTDECVIYNPSIGNSFDFLGFDDQVDSGQCKAGVQEPILKEYWALQVFSQLIKESLIWEYYYM